MDQNQKQKSKKRLPQANPLESLRDLGSSTANTLKKDVLRPGDFMDQLFGPKPSKTFSGEIMAGESMEMKDVYEGKHEEKQTLKKQLTFERRIRYEDSASYEKKQNELKIQLHALTEEVVALASSTEGLSTEVQSAAMQAPIEPGVYHVIFFQKLIEFIKSFRKSISEATTWLHASNGRAQKKNSWGAKYKKHGAKYLLSGEHYLTRSAG